ncbi:carotenoid oxygenase family protein [Nocardioides dongxiaopingii]|uniref:carotenoid oxygenase family protein n=1 Tax=Nocardioides dongxiaopingii TaxID=2576036 RepID=UPI0010C7699D|nr:carotenoid oxygenase family protein [Nocardioides dongxiaopingii]
MSRYLQDEFAPVAEELTALDLTVSGRLPAHLDGRYLRIGPNPAQDPAALAAAGYHWFLGEGMVHGVRLEDGHARWYRNRWVRPDAGDFAPNTNVVQHAGRTMALVEAGAPPYELDDELDTVGRCGFAGDLRAGYTAHPHEDPATGELHAVSYSWTRGNRVDYSVLDAAGSLRHQLEIEVHGSPMMHDCALTEHHLVVYDLPVTFDIDMVAGKAPRPLRLPTRLALNRVVGRNPVSDKVVEAMTRGRGVPTQLPYSWDDDYPARIGLLPRDATDGSAVRWFDVDPCYVFHTLNAFEVPGTDEVVVDVVRHDRMFATRFDGPDEGPASLVRFTLDLASGRASEHRFDEHPQEFPRHDERLTGRRHRFGYSVGFDDGRLGDTVLKHDTVAGTTQERRLGAGRLAGEMTFVPSSPDAAEDDGVLMGYVHDLARGLSDLVLLDAGTLEDVATVHLPGRVPAGFHGSWAPAL